VRGHDLRALIRGGATDDELAGKLAEIWRVRGDRYSELRSKGIVDPAVGEAKVEMSYIGG
jgi:cyclic pyranopterin phosphate synthase